MSRHPWTRWLVSGAEIALAVWLVRHPLDRWLRGWTSGNIVIVIEIAVGLFLTLFMFWTTEKLRRD